MYQSADMSAGRRASMGKQNSTLGMYQCITHQNNSEILKQSSWSIVNVPLYVRNKDIFRGLKVENVEAEMKRYA